MIWFAIFLIVVLISFSFVLLFGAPYLPTLKSQIETALELADLKKGQTLLELGCGDGRVAIAAAKQGITVVGYELNPLMALIAWLRSFRYRKQIKIVCGNFWTSDWPKADAIFVFLLPKYMPKLDKKIEEYNHKPLRLISFAFAIKKRKPSKQKNGLFCYDYQK